MKRWSLRCQLIGWSTLVGSVVLILSGIGTLLFFQREQLEALDRQLNHEAKIFLEEWQHRPTDFDWKKTGQIRQLFPATRTERYVEITDSRGQRMYRSNNWDGSELIGLQPGLHRVQVGHHSQRLAIYPEGEIVLYLATDLAEVEKDTRALALSFLFSFPLMIGIVVFGAWWVAQRALAPIRRITDAAEQITAARLDQRLPQSALEDEIGRLTEVFNAMIARLAASFQQAERFSADASHELKTPLTVLHAAIEDLLHSPTLPATDGQAVAGLLEQTQRLSSIIQALLLLTRADAGNLQIDAEETDMKEIILLCAEDAGIVAKKQAISLEIKLPAVLTAWVDRGRAEQILLNLFDNAVKYNRTNGRVVIEAATRSSGEVVVTVGNTGQGISAKDAPQLFERFFRPASSLGIAGFGLGLGLARELARARACSWR